MSSEDKEQKIKAAYSKGWDVGHSGEAPSRYFATFANSEERSAFLNGVCAGTVDRNNEQAELEKTRKGGGHGEPRV